MFILVVYILVKNNSRNTTKIREFVKMKEQYEDV